jgi:hypothetical protein
MNNKVELGEIVFCDLTIIHKGHKHKIKDVVYKNKGNNTFCNMRNLKDLNIKECVRIENIDIISRLGFENKSKGFTEVKGSNEKRNKITGAYE